MLQTLFLPTGRVNRLQWWLVGLGIFVFNSLAPLFGLITYVPTVLKTGQTVVMPQPTLLYGVLALVLLWLSICTNINRYHDRGKSGWWVLMPLSPLLMAFPYFYVAFSGSPGMLVGASVLYLILTLVFCLWSLVELGFFSGELSYNDYGAPPMSGFGSVGDEAAATSEGRVWGNATRTASAPPAAPASAPLQRPSDGPVRFGRRG